MSAAPKSEVVKIFQISPFDTANLSQSSSPLTPKVSETNRENSKHSSLTSSSQNDANNGSFTVSLLQNPKSIPRDASKDFIENWNLSDDILTPFSSGEERKDKITLGRGGPFCTRVEEINTEEGQGILQESLGNLVNDESYRNDNEDQTVDKDDEDSKVGSHDNNGENNDEDSFRRKRFDSIEAPEDYFRDQAMGQQKDNSNGFTSNLMTSAGLAASWPESGITTAQPVSQDIPCDDFVCDCSKKKKQASCCGRQYKLRHIPRVPAYVTTFRLWMASLGELTKEKLGNLSNYHIKTMDLQNNRIMILDNDTFVLFTHLESLDLGSNPISAVMLRDAFYSIGSSKFVALRLDSMFIYDLPDNFFDAFQNKSFDIISIANNSLTTFNARTFSPFRSVIRLILSDNSIYSFVLNNTVYAKKLHLERNVLTSLPLLCSSNGGLVFPNLFSLYLGGNPFKSVSAGILRGLCLPKLHKLDISSSIVLKSLGNNFVADLPMLVNLMAGNMASLSRYEPFCFNSSSLEKLFLKGNKVWDYGTIVPGEIFAHAPNLKTVDMTKIKFNLNTEVDLARMLLPAKSLVTLNMEACLLGSLPADTFSQLPNLRTLDFIGNHISAFSLAPAFRNVTRLDTLILQANQITIVNESTFPLEFRRSIRVLDLSKNDFACTCDLLWFKSWIEQERKSGNISFPDYPKYYRCRTPDNLRGQYISDYNPSYRDCHPLSIYVVVGSAVGAVVLVTALTLSLAYRYRWYLRYYVYRLRRRRQYKPIVDEDDGIVYDIYIAYSQFDVEWVAQELAPLLEASPDVKVSTIKRGADKETCTSMHLQTDTILHIADNIVQYMDQSSRIVLVLSDGYAREGWSGYEFNNVIYAANEQHKDVIVILKGDIEAGRLTKDMRRLLTGGTFLHWEETEEAMGMFKDALNVALRTRGNLQELV
ncbi:hypothetical protein C0Q70_05540 [Pomacea canaliculata]|uniref:TIR domain-containing protein n=1 Tax=Pomacea canaliculata TaxID=400727 RepID=A0A2T7PLG4_POMCA|nr:hypothetical protein C0Q70_05540 [Pomacea canaliculata]